MKLLRDSIDRDPPVPRIEDEELPSHEEFYSGSIPEWTQDDETDEIDAGTNE